MSAAETEVVVRSAVPVPDLSAIDEGLAAGVVRLKEVVQLVRPADLGRDLSRRTIDQARRILDASDDRRAAAMLRAAHPAVAANVFGVCQADRAARILDFMPTDHQVAILGAMQPSIRAQRQDALGPAEKVKVERILSYGETAVARLMTPKVWRCQRTMTIGDALEVTHMAGRWRVGRRRRRRQSTMREPENICLNRALRLGRKWVGALDRALGE